ncbi:MAG: 16S rRNA (cytidine(1402)-2'-O)-methyltransferase [Candidatus Rhabdochlamydia sp.]
MLYLIATPIGNLQDITLRALETLKRCDYVLCEDTRRSVLLLKEYQITVPLYSFHQFNEKKSEDKIICDLKQGMTIGLISDAGTPGICDPGESLVKRCYAEQIPLTSLPGPCAFAVALSLTPFSKERVQFLGFLPKKLEERRKELAQSLLYRGTTIFYESPQRVADTLKLLPPFIRVCLFRELSKLYEECKLGTAEELLREYEFTPPRGECVMVVEPISWNYPEMSLNEHVSFIQELFHLSLAESIKIVADIQGIPKRDVYHAVHIEP